MGFTQIRFITICTVALFYVVSITFVFGDDVIFQKQSERNRLDVDEFADNYRPRKRPFCNAFTGCGKKRTDQSMANLVNFDFNPNTDDLTKRIFLEAKLWHAIQVARAEAQRLNKNSKIINQEKSVSPDLPLGIALNNLKKKRSVAKLKNKTLKANVKSVHDGNKR